jgi:hypothetical protein
VPLYRNCLLRAVVRSIPFGVMSDNVATSEWMSVTQAARVIGVTRPTVMSMVARRELPELVEVAGVWALPSDAVLAVAKHRQSKVSA